MATALIGGILRRNSNDAFLVHLRMTTKPDLLGHLIGILPLPQSLLPKPTSRKLISRTLCSDFSLAVAPFLCYQSSSFGTVAECDIKTGISSSNGLAIKSKNKNLRMKSKVDFTKIDPSLLPTVIIVGRPNVGKSALFNRLIRRREALVYNTPDDHVTRDIREGIAKLGDLRFKVLDSAGLETEATSGTILSRTTEMTGMVLARTQLAILLIDVRDGLQPLDLEVGKWMRKHASNVHIIVAMNKSESLDERGLVTAAAGEAHSLGFGDPIAISAETGLGMAEMYETLRPLLEDYALQLPNGMVCHPGIEFVTGLINHLNLTS